MRLHIILEAQSPYYQNIKQGIMVLCLTQLQRNINQLMIDRVLSVFTSTSLPTLILSIGEVLWNLKSCHLKMEMRISMMLSPSPALQDGHPINFYRSKYRTTTFKQSNYSLTWKTIQLMRLL